jgi:ABC-type transport system involved in multi-copper enzyme maturation permease subunit
MTAETLTQDRTITHRATGGPLLGFRTVFRKEVTEWLRGRAAFIVAAVAIASAIFTTVIPFIVKATGEAAEGLTLTNDPTANVLLGWRGAQTYAVIAVLATMALITAERDRGTLSWSLSNPLSPSSFIAAKFCAAVTVVGTAIVIVPLAISAVVATVAYGAVPDLGRVAVFGALFLTVPIFYIGLNVTLGSFVKSTAGVAGIALLVMFLPSAVGGLFPIVNEASPTSIGTWAWLTATGTTASMLTLAGWAISMVVLAVGAKLIFERQEF